MQYRSGKEQPPLGFYPTLPSTIEPLLPLLPKRTRFIEPCAGDYSLAGYLEQHGHECVFASDLEPRHEEVCVRDAGKHDFRSIQADMVITNFPYRKQLLKPILENLIPQIDIWMVIYSSWLDTLWAAKFMEHAAIELPIGRARWPLGVEVTDPGGAGKRDFSWVLFTPTKQPTVRLPLSRVKGLNDE